MFSVGEARPRRIASRRPCLSRPFRTLLGSASGAGVRGVVGGGDGGGRVAGKRWGDGGIISNKICICQLGC